MDFVTFLAGIVIVWYGRRLEAEGAGLPVMVGGICITLFGLVWILATRTHWLPE